MSVPGCAVLVAYRRNQDFSEDTGLVNGHSGILIGERWVLCHGSILLSVLGPPISDLLESLNTGQLIALPDQLPPELSLSIYRRMSLHENTQEGGIRKNMGKFVGIWKCPLLAETIETSLEGWTFEKFGQQVRALLPIFLAIELKSNRNEPKIEHVGKNLEKKVRRIEGALFRFAGQIQKVDRADKGSVVEVISTPFGNSLFLESLTRGIISNVFGIEGCAILTDTNVFPGCEGSPLYVLAASKRKICGMVVAPSCSCRGETVDYAFAVNLSSTLHRILRKEPSPSILLSASGHSTSRNCNSDNIGSLESGIAVVRCGSSWGTGILVDERTGTFLTCAHVVAEVLRSAIRITRCKDNIEISAEAKLVYRTVENVPYDIAVLRTEADGGTLLNALKAVKLACESVRRGEEVLVAAFPFFSSGIATISSGVVSRSLRCMIQTSCRVQSGASGAPIFSRQTHEMVGMVVCNAVCWNGSTVYSRLSMAIPVSVLAGPLAQYLHTTDARVLEALTERDTTVQRIWKLQPLTFSNL